MERTALGVLSFWPEKEIINNYLHILIKCLQKHKKLYVFKIKTTSDIYISSVKQ